MDDRVRKILRKQGREAKRHAKVPIARRELFSRLALVALAVFVIWKVALVGDERSGPPQLTEVERITARDIARTTNISLQDAENAVLAHRANAAERRQWQKERRDREAAGEAMQRAFPN